MEKIKQVCDRGAKALDLQPVDRVDVANDFIGGIAARTGVEQTAECALILRALINVRNAEFGLP